MRRIRSRLVYSQTLSKALAVADVEELQYGTPRYTHVIRNHFHLSTISPDNKELVVYTLLIMIGGFGGYLWVCPGDLPAMAILKLMFHIPQHWIKIGKYKSAIAKSLKIWSTSLQIHRVHRFWMVLTHPQLVNVNQLRSDWCDLPQGECSWVRATACAASIAACPGRDHQHGEELRNFAPDLWDFTWSRRVQGSRVRKLA